MTTAIAMPQMTPEQQWAFNTWYAATRRDELLGVLLALLLGSFGAHHFYLRRTGLGVLYLVFFWTGIPAILGFIEAFFMPGRVRDFNMAQAAAITQAVLAGASLPGTPLPMTACPQCGATQQTGTRYCAHCGRPLV